MSQPTRSCGSCTMCCKVLPIKELEKPGGVWCQHAQPGRGCAIHGEHPATCQAFLCQWLVHPGIPDALQPSRSKVILTTARGSHETQLVAYCDASDPNAWRRAPMYPFLKQQTRDSAGQARGVVVWVGKRMWLITPNGDHDLGEPSGSRSFRIEPGPDGKETVRLIEGP